MKPEVQDLQPQQCLVLPRGVMQRDHHRIARQQRPRHQIRGLARDSVHAVGDGHETERRQQNLCGRIKVDHQQHAGQRAHHNGQLEALLARPHVQTRFENTEKNQRKPHNQARQHIQRARLHHVQRLKNQRRSQVQPDQDQGNQPLLGIGAPSARPRGIDPAACLLQEHRRRIVEIHADIGQWKGF